MPPDIAATTPPRRRGTLERPDCRIYYEVTGEGPAIVFAHGLGGNHLSWFQQVAHFAPRYTCVTFAHRGFAPSSVLPGGPDPRDYADDLQALIAHLALPDVRVVGQSMGGWSTVDYALRRPAGLKGIVLAATTGSIDPRLVGEPASSRLMAWSQAVESMAARLFAAGIHPAAGSRMAMEQPAMHLLYRHIDDQNADLDKQALRKRLFESRSRAPRELAAAAPCPILFIVGDEDVVIPPIAADAIAAEIPGARVEHIPDAGHSAYFERPAVFNRMVGEFLEGTRG